MNKERYQKYIQQERQKYIDKLCEYCNKKHDHTYGSGRFCSKSCRMSFIASQNKFSKKHKEHLKKLHNRHKVPYGTWKCEQCNLIFETRAQLYYHNTCKHGKVPCICLVGKEKKYMCPYCGKEYDKSQQIGGHLSNCPNHPNKKLHDLGHKKSAETFHKRYEAGEITISNFSHPHSLETKQHLSEIRAAQVKNEYLTNFHAKVKWYKVQNLEGIEFSVRGMWEVNVSKRLNELGILWIKAPAIKYFKEYWHNYTADFYIPNKDIYIEVKGRYPDADREKMRLVVKQNLDKKIYFIHDTYYNFISGKIQFDDNLLISENDL